MAVIVDDGTVDSTILVRAMAERSHGMEREEVTQVTHPEPVQRAVIVQPSAACVPQNARRIATQAIALGWPVWITHAVGYDYDTKTGGVRTTSIKEPTGEETPTGRVAMKEVGRAQAPAVHSVRVVVKAPDRIFAGHWVDNAWRFGLSLAGHVVMRNCGWDELRKEFADAQSRANMRGETPDGQLPLEGHDGKPL